MIDFFKDEYFFLSNFYPCDVEYEDLMYNSVEAAFQSAKTFDDNKRLYFCTYAPNVAKAKGKQLKLREDWEQVKDDIMYQCIRDKFTRNNRLKYLLLRTDKEEIVESNTWHDNIWGNCICDKCTDIEGQNKLGKILMKIREELKHV